MVTASGTTTPHKEATRKAGFPTPQHSVAVWGCGCAESVSAQDFKVPFFFFAEDRAVCVLVGLRTAGKAMTPRSSDLSSSCNIWTVCVQPLLPWLDNFFIVDKPK